MERKIRLPFAFLVSAVSLAGILCSCTPTLKNPNDIDFLKYENEVTKEQWWEKYEEAMNQSFLFNDNTSAFSTSIKQSTSTNRRQTEKSEKKEKELEYATASNNQTASLKVDTTRKTMEVKNTKKSSSTNKSLEIYLGDDSTKYSKSRILQINEFEGKDHIFSVNKDLKVYQVLEELNDTFSFSMKSKNVLRSQFSAFLDLKDRIKNSYIGLDNSVSKFYIDGTVFTCTYTRDFTTALEDYILKEYRNIVFQFDFSEEQVGQFTHTWNTTYTYNSESDARKVVYNKSTTQFEGHLTLKTQKVNSVNLSSYDRVLEDLD